MEDKKENKVKRNVKKVIATCLVAVLTLSVLVLFVPGVVYKIAMKKFPAAYQETLFYSELDISFDEESLVEYEVEGIKFSLPESYVISEETEYEHSTTIKFSKSGCDDFLFGVSKREEYKTEPTDITSQLFSNESGMYFIEQLPLPDYHGTEVWLRPTYTHTTGEEKPITIQIK